MALSAPELLSARHDLAEFSCGQPALDHWLKTRALANQERGFTVVMVVQDALRVVGYYGLAPTAVLAAVLPRRIRTGQPPDPVPCLLLAQLATDVAYSRQGIGTGLLKHALIRCVAGARLIGGRALVVHALDLNNVPDRSSDPRIAPSAAGSNHQETICPEPFPKRSS